MNYEEKEILEERLGRLRQLSKNLDESFTIPGTNIKFVLTTESILNLIILMERRNTKGLMCTKNQNWLTSCSLMNWLKE